MILEPGNSKSMAPASGEGLVLHHNMPELMSYVVRQSKHAKELTFTTKPFPS